jgi:two-component system sensor histidine kinase HydH
VVTVQDVTEIRREGEEDGRRQRLEALGRMAAELAHEVRNPLGAIRLFATLLCEDLAHRPSWREMAEQVLQASSRLEVTVSNLLAFAAPTRAELRETDLCRLARETCALLGPTSRARGVLLAGPAEAEVCPVWGDPEGLSQVLLNLVGNALAATAGGGRILVQVQRLASQSRLVVQDSGCGIASEDLPRVFDPFFSRTAGGTGLGLSIVHRIVESHGGSVRLDSTPGVGTRAVVELPAPAGEGEPR